MPGIQNLSVLGLLCPYVTFTAHLPGSLSPRHARIWQRPRGKAREGVHGDSQLHRLGPDVGVRPAKGQDQK